MLWAPLSPCASFSVTTHHVYLGGSFSSSTQSHIRPPAFIYPSHSAFDCRHERGMHGPARFADLWTPLTAAWQSTVWELLGQGSECLHCTSLVKGILFFAPCLRQRAACSKCYCLALQPEAFFRAFFCSVSPVGTHPTSPTLCSLYGRNANWMILLQIPSSRRTGLRSRTPSGKGVGRGGLRVQQTLKLSLSVWS